MANGLSSLRSALVLAGLTVGAAQAHAASYTCKDEKGGTIFQQTPCKAITPPASQAPKAKLTCQLTDDQVTRARRREDQFLALYPDEAVHRQKEEKDAKPMAHRIDDAKARLNDLAEQRKPLDKEREFYVGKPMPSALKSKVDANDAQSAAMAEILRGREQALADLQARYQCERATFGMMWKGAAPGSSACNRPACAQP